MQCSNYALVALALEGVLKRRQTRPIATQAAQREEQEAAEKAAILRIAHRLEGGR
jgi:hypothetical protein